MKNALREGQGLRLLLPFLLVPYAHAEPAAGSCDVRQILGGIEVHAGAAAMRIEALREDTLRIRMTPDGRWQEDASWAVLPSSRVTRIAVQSLSDGVGCGFLTKELKVFVDPATLQLHVEDLEGHVISEDAPGQPAAFHGPRTEQGGAFQVWKTLHADEHFFGLGDKTGPLDRRGEVFVDWNKDSFDFQESTDPIYKSIPFFLGESGARYYGVFVDNTWRTVFDFGKAEENAISFASTGGPLDYYLMAGPGPKKVITDYAWLTGTQSLPPLWSLGFQQSRNSYSPESELREVAAHMRKDKIPADVLWLDIDYQDAFKPFTVDHGDFPNMPKLLADMRADGYHVVAITDLHVADKPGTHYAPYESGKAIDAFAKSPGGKDYVGESWPGPALFPDFTRAKVREWWGSNYKQFSSWGFGGYWNDMNEPSIRSEANHTMPTDVVEKIEGSQAEGFADRMTTHLELHNVYGMLNARSTFEGAQKNAPGERPYVMTRATYAGGQRYSVTWTGDNSSTWNHLKLSNTMLLNLGLSGYSFAGADVGGFIGSPSPELLTRWVEVSSFQPIQRDHSTGISNPQEMWVGGAAQEDIRRKYLETRYKLLPYSYTLAEETARTGIPMMRPIFLEFPNATADGHPFDVNRNLAVEFLWGPDLLIAPAPFMEKVDAYRPDLPSDGWFDFWTGKRRPSYKLKKGTNTADDPNLVHPQLGVLPVYVRPGAIIPMQAVTQSTMEVPRGPLELRVYLPLAGTAVPCEGDLYSDDGHSLAYQKGEYLRVHLTCTQTKGGLEVALGQQEGSYVPWWKQIEVVVYGWDGAHTTATLSSGGSVSAAKYDAVAHTIRVIIAQSAAARTLSFAQGASHN